MSFAPKKKLGPGSTARGKSINKNDSQLCINKSFENTRLVMGQRLMSSHSIHQLDQWNNTEDNTPQISAQQPPFDQATNSKIQKIFDRLGFLEDAMSRVELQYDSMRPFIKQMENSNLFNKVKKNHSKENSTSFVNGQSFEKMLKSQNSHNVSQTFDASINQTSSMLTKEDIQHMIMSSLEHLQKDQIQQNQHISQNFERLENFIEELKSDLVHFKERPSQQPLIEHLAADLDLSELQNLINEQFVAFKNQLDCLQTKVDSMDNSYDKRISNLEAVITPLLAERTQQVTPQKIQEIIKSEFNGTLVKGISQLIDDRIRHHIAEKDRQIQILEKDIIALKAKDNYFSNGSHQKVVPPSQQQQHLLQSPLISKSLMERSSSTPSILAHLPPSHSTVTRHQQSQLLTKLTKFNTDTKDYLEDLESYILSTSETINEKLEDIHKQMADLDSEISANIELVNQKKQIQSADTEQFIMVLGEDVRQFLQCMREELDQAGQAVKEREERCQIDMQRILKKIETAESMRAQIQTPNNSGNYSSQKQSDISPQDRKELVKIDAFKEHRIALQRHMDNTTQYLQKEILGIENKIAQAKQVLLQELDLNLNEDDNIVSGSSVVEKIDKHIKAVVEEEDNEDDEDDNQLTHSEDTEDYGHIDEDGSLRGSDQYQHPPQIGITEVDSHLEHSYNHTHVTQNHPQIPGFHGNALNPSHHPHTNQPFYYSGFNHASSPAYNIEIFESNNSNEQQTIYESNKEIEIDIERHMQYRTSSTINDELVPLKAQKSPQHSVSGGVSRYLGVNHNVQNLRFDQI